MRGHRSAVNCGNRMHRAVFSSKDVISLDEQNGIWLWICKLGNGFWKRSLGHLIELKGGLANFSTVVWLDQTNWWGTPMVAGNQRISSRMKPVWQDAVPCYSLCDYSEVIWEHLGSHLYDTSIHLKFSILCAYLCIQWCGFSGSDSESQGSFFV